MVQNFGPPLIDFSPLGQLGERYDRGVRRDREAATADARQKALAGFGQNGDLAALGTTLLRAGDLEGGMQALRMAQAGQGTPWQREQAAKEQERYEAGRADTAEERRKADERYRESLTRADRPRYEPNLKEDGRGLGGMMGGRVFPDGKIIYDDGTTNFGPGPQSGGAGDPNVPSIGGVPAQGSGVPGTSGPGPVTDTGQPEYGYAIPGTGARYPHGTIMLPKGAPAPVIAPPQGRAAVAAPPVVTPPADVPAQGAQPNQALAPPAQAGQTAVAAPAAPIQRRASRADPLEPDTAPFVRAAPPNTNVKEWVTAETKRLQSLAGGEGPTTDMRNKLAKARQVAPLVERELNNLNKLVQESGTEYFPGAVKAEMQTTYGNLLMQLKEMYGLGALQAKDIEMVEKLLTDPTASGWNPLEAAYKGMTQKGVTSAQVAKVKQILRDGLIEAEKNLGGEPGRVPEVSKTTGTSSYTSKSGVEVKW
jgi:hypothetical protein